LRGAIAYLYGVLVTLVWYACKQVSLKGDFGEFRGPAFLVATANARQYGGGMKIVPEASIDDGCLDVCIVRPISKLQVVRMLPRVFSGTHVTHPAVDIKKSRLMEITSGEPLSLWADGEPIGSTPATIEVVPQALRVLVPAASNKNGSEPCR
jgi:diacylglycerol kinase (ATP)